MRCQIPQIHPSANPWETLLRVLIFEKSLSEPCPKNQDTAHLE